MKKAPDFTLSDQNGTPHRLADYRGKWLVLYFYPKDDTPGCTAEACSFRDEREVIAEHGAEIVGISKDSVASHKRFAEKYSLTFTLLSDEDHQVIEAYGAWSPKKMFGREYLGTQRKTFIIDPNGDIVREYPDVTPKEHAREIIHDLAELKSS
jgi:thioredoxin-dependent peroxiredoxin